MMKPIPFFYLLLLLASAFTGCQQEAEVIRLPLPEEAFKAGSAEADLITRATLHDGSPDNILDNASCASLVFPVTVWVNGQEMIVMNEDDLKYIERILDAADDDQDEVSIVFPVTVVLADHAEVVVNDEETFADILNDCVEGGADDDIECIDFIYPLKIAVYNTNNQVSDVLTMSSDTELYAFIEALDDDEWVSFTFPVVMHLADGTELTITDNVALEEAIENASDACDEDDDNDFDDDDFDDSNFVAMILSGDWKVDYFFDETDETSAFSGFTFTFFADGTAIASDGTSTVEGTWASYGDDGGLEFDLYFGEETPFDEIGEDWDVTAFTTSSITLKDDADDVSAKTLIFEKL